MQRGQRKSEAMPKIPGSANGPQCFPPLSLPPVEQFPPQPEKTRQSKEGTFSLSDPWKQVPGNNLLVCQVRTDLKCCTFLLQEYLVVTLHCRISEDFSTKFPQIIFIKHPERKWKGFATFTSQMSVRRTHSRENLGCEKIQRNLLTSFDFSCCCYVHYVVHNMYYYIQNWRYVIILLTPFPIFRSGIIRALGNAIIRQKSDSRNLLGFSHTPECFS